MMPELGLRSELVLLGEGVKVQRICPGEWAVLIPDVYVSLGLNSHVLTYAVIGYVLREKRGEYRKHYGKYPPNYYPPVVDHKTRDDAVLELLKA